MRVIVTSSDKLGEWAHAHTNFVPEAGCYELPPEVLADELRAALRDRAEVKYDPSHGIIFVKSQEKLDKRETSSQQFIETLVGAMLDNGYEPEPE